MSNWKIYGKNCKWAIKDPHGYLFEINALRGDTIHKWLSNFDQNKLLSKWSYWKSQGYLCVKVFIQEVEHDR